MREPSRSVPESEARTSEQGRPPRGARARVHDFALVVWSKLRAAPCDAVVALGIAVFAGALRLYRIDGKSLWVDEIQQAVAAHLPLPGLFEQVKGNVASTPLDFLGERLVTGVFGNGTAATRLWAFGVGCLAVVVVYFVAKQLFKSRQAGFLAAVCLATSPFAIYYSQEARFYSLAILVTAVNVLAFNRAWERGGRGNWLAYAGASALVLYSSYFPAAVLLPTEGVFVFTACTYRWLSGGRQREALRQAVIQTGSCAGAMLLALALFSPWLVYATLPALGQTHGATQLPALDGKQVLGILVELFGTALYTAGLAASLLTGCIVAAAVVGSTAALKSRRGVAVVLIITIVAAIPFAWAADTRAQYWWATKQIAFVVPLVCVLAGGGLWTIVRAIERAAGPALHSGLARNALVLVLAVGWLMLSWSPIARIYLTPAEGGIPKDDWRGVTQLISTTACPDAAFLVNIPGHPYHDFGIGYYDPQLLPRTQFLILPTGNLSNIATGSFGPHDWLVVFTYGLGAGSLDQMSSALTASGWMEHDFISIRAYQHGASCSSRPSP